MKPELQKELLPFKMILTHFYRTHNRWKEIVNIKNVFGTRDNLLRESSNKSAMLKFSFYPLQELLPLKGVFFGRTIMNRENIQITKIFSTIINTNRSTLRKLSTDSLQELLPLNNQLMYFLQKLKKIIKNNIIFMVHRKC